MTGARSVMNKQQKTPRKRQSLGGGKRKTLKKKKKPMKLKSPKRKQKQPTISKSQQKSDKTKISIYSCPSKSVEMNCLSCRTKVYRNCPIPEATKITKVQVLQEYPSSFGQCEVGRNKNFGVKDDSNIWVNYGCRAKFLVCYEKSIHEPKTVNCICKGPKQRCSTGLQGVGMKLHVKVNMLWSFGSGKCREGQTWGYNEDEIWVDHDCSATFRVFW